METSPLGAAAAATYSAARTVTDAASGLISRLSFGAVMSDSPPGRAAGSRTQSSPTRSSSPLGLIGGGNGNGSGKKEGFYSQVVLLSVGLFGFEDCAKTRGDLSYEVTDSDVLSEMLSTQHGTAKREPQYYQYDREYHCHRFHHHHNHHHHSHCRPNQNQQQQQQQQHTLKSFGRKSGNGNGAESFERIAQATAIRQRRYLDLRRKQRDMVGRFSHSQVAGLLNQWFRVVDDIMDKYSIEKIKTVGDVYIAAIGIHMDSNFPADERERVAWRVRNALDACFSLQQEIHRFNALRSLSFQLTMGVDVGDCIAGVLGLKRICYDVYGLAPYRVLALQQNAGAPPGVYVTEPVRRVLSSPQLADVFLKMTEYQTTLAGAIDGGSLSLRQCDFDYAASIDEKVEFDDGDENDFEDLQTIYLLEKNLPEL